MALLPPLQGARRLAGSPQAARNPCIAPNPTPGGRTASQPAQVVSSTPGRNLNQHLLRQQATPSDERRRRTPASDSIARVIPAAKPSGITGNSYFAAVNSCAQLRSVNFFSVL